MARKYEQRRRAEQQEETRQRIARAALELHALIGPANTSLSAIAERAGVQRNTLYRHFPEERELSLACSGLFFEENPLPDPADWQEVTDPVERVRRALGDLYAFWEAHEALMANVTRDAEVHDLTREVAAARTEAPMAAIRDALLGSWPRGRQRKTLRAAVELAISFRTWQSLVRHSGLTTPAAADLMTRTLDCAARR